MQLGKSAVFVHEEARQVSDALNRWFPTPSLLSPHAIGIDISDTSIKWLSLKPVHGGGVAVDAFGEQPLKEGIVVGGIVKDGRALATSLSIAKEHFGGSSFVHAALPEEAAYIFSMHVPEGTSRQQTLRMVEFEFEGRVPIQPAASVYDFDVIHEHGESGREIGVTVFPRELAESYHSVFAEAGLTLFSLESEARSIARAVCTQTHAEPITLLVDFGRTRTGFAVLKRCVPIFTSTVEVGGNTILDTLTQKLAMSAKAAEAFANEQGLLAEGSDRSAAYEAIVATASALADEVARHFHYWDTRRNEHGERVTPVGRVLLVGGGANLRGLTDFIAARVQAPTEIGNIWRHICDLDTCIPPIDKRHSLKYATAAGLALRAIL